MKRKEMKRKDRLCRERIQTKQLMYQNCSCKSKSTPKNQLESKTFVYFTKAANNWFEHAPS
jgi:hypothetical protein